MTLVRLILDYTLFAFMALAILVDVALVIGAIVAYYRETYPKPRKRRRKSP